MPSPLLFDFHNKIITVPIADSSLDVQFLIDEIRSAEQNLAPGIAYNKIADAFGKQDLGGGVRVGITVVLLDGWKVAFAARPGPSTVSVTISGGNFVGEAGANPISPTAYTQVTVAQSTSATLVSSEADTNLVYLVETLRSMHPAFGTAYYWDPDNGNDANAGTSPSTAKKTFAATQALTSSGNNDVIFCRPTGSGGTSTSTETLNITTNNLKVRGPGNSMQLIPTATTDPTVTIAANNVEVSGFYIQTAATGSQNAISIEGNNILARDCWVGSSQNHGVTITNSARFRMLTSVIENCEGNGINLGNNTTQALISKAIIYNCQNGILLSGTTVNDNIIENSLIYKNTAYGISIGTGVNRTSVRSQNTIINNTSGNTTDSGTDSYIETPTGGASASEIADAVWDEVISSHTTSGTTGRALKDTKLKATLASIK
ncbi:hypothetical protein A2572_03395 [Candidatus Collierbacteria bacterium RIFOXYD1_FULL_40_9]|uniref:Right handed beta helix domain-containing protein n=1 Tax=Candidatus Collierbacteria bacterium RIFOXYD1_FULL_40_9 TaxID=1817731 RepID=A0A1F5FX36_9BACT|nr:MAG: hypothetical protein A2572_03395 [Candidatus Collierbacteria bacterium RIFOXYD1_FULL_40_9]